MSGTLVKFSVWVGNRCCVDWTKPPERWSQKDENGKLCRWYKVSALESFLVAVDALRAADRIADIYGITDDVSPIVYRRRRGLKDFESAWDEVTLPLNGPVDLATQGGTGRGAPDV